MTVLEKVLHSLSVCVCIADIYNVLSVVQLQTCFKELTLWSFIHPASPLKYSRLINTQ